ncbi:MAG: alpha/beta hydrolase [Methanosphaera sp.]|nr:alpha/beta hydrolase [Methanosphaera sp.]
MTQRSILSRIAEFILKKSKPKYMDSQEEIKLFLADKQDEPVRTIFHTEEFEDMKLVTMGHDYDNSHVIIYLHGGAYVNQLNYQHTIYCYLLSRILRIPIILPAYPLAPEHDYIDAYDFMYKLYSRLCQQYDHITLMGDSAGGGFILGFSQYINSTSLRQADNIIAFSPWVDLSMRYEYDDKEDPILGTVGLKEIGKKWAAKDIFNYMASPLYGDNQKLPRTLITVGTNEIFYQDVKRYYEKLVDNDVDVELIIGKDLFHIYPLFPIPEAINMIKKIRKEIR